MDIKNYNSDLHKHIISTWAASTAASQITFRFSVECGMKLILLGANGSFMSKPSPILLKKLKILNLKRNMIHGIIQ